MSTGSASPHHVGIGVIGRMGIRGLGPYALRDVDGTPITETQGRMIVKDRYQIEPRRRDNIRHQRMRDRRKQAADQESQESPSAPTSQPAKRKLTSRQVA